MFTPYIKDTDSMYGHAAQIFKVKTLLNNAFKFMVALNSKVLNREQCKSHYKSTLIQ